MTIHHGDTETRSKERPKKTPCLSDSVVNASWEQPDEPQPEWRSGDVGGNFERTDRETLWRFFYSRDPKKRTITGRKHDHGNENAGPSGKTSHQR